MRRSGFKAKPKALKRIGWVRGERSRREVPLPRQKPLKKVSKAQRRRLKGYFEARDEYLAQYPVCGICLVRGLTPMAATEVHHARGRVGSLLIDTRFFVPSCRPCREWPHENPKEARALGVLAGPAEWNTPPK